MFNNFKFILDDFLKNLQLVCSLYQKETFLTLFMMMQKAVPYCQIWLLLFYVLGCDNSIVAQIFKPPESVEV